MLADRACRRSDRTGNGFPPSKGKDKPALENGQGPPLITPPPLCSLARGNSHHSRTRLRGVCAAPTRLAQRLFSPGFQIRAFGWLGASCHASLALSHPKESLPFQNRLNGPRGPVQSIFALRDYFGRGPSALLLSRFARAADPEECPLLRNRLRGVPPLRRFLRNGYSSGQHGSSLLYKKSPSQYQGRGMPRGATLVRPAAAGLAQALNAGYGPHPVLRSPSSEAFTPPGRGKRRTKQRRAQRCLGRPSVPGALSVAARPP